MKGGTIMTYTNHRARFKGDLAGVKQEELRELDFNLTTIQERMDYIEKKYERVGAFYDEYIDEYYKVDVNTTDCLSEDINIFQNIERDADYILNSVDLPRDRQQKYKFYTRGEFESLLNKEKRNYTFDAPESSEIMEILEPNNGNYYLDTEVKIKPSDFDDEKIGNILTEYDALRKVLKEEMRKIKSKEESKYDLGFVKRNLGQIKADMIETKKILKCIMRPSTKTVSCKHEPDYSWLNYANVEHIKVLLASVPFGDISPEDCLSHVAYDMEVAVKTLYEFGKLDDIDMKIVELLNGGETERTIASIIGKGKTTVRQRIDKICKRIAKFYEN